jgi:hypothetical protein
VVTKDESVRNLQAAYPAMKQETAERLADLIHEVVGEVGQGPQATELFHRRLAEAVVAGEEWAQEAFFIEMVANLDKGEDGHK